MDSYAAHFNLDPNVTFLNHGSFGACPLSVQEVQAALHGRMHRQPVTFFARDLPALLADARAKLASFIGADPGGVAFVPNASTGVSTVLRSLKFQPGDEILITDHGYNACNNAARFVCEESGAKLVWAKLPFPLKSPDEITNAILGATTERTKLALIDHVTSPTGLVLPIDEIVKKLAARGVDTLVDGAHGPGMLELDLTRLGAAYYTGNCHKWLSAGKGAAFLHVRADRRDRIRPLVISHGASLPPSPERFLIEFDWLGTDDPTPFLTIPTAIDFWAKLLPGGWPAVRAELRVRALLGRRIVAERLSLVPPAPESMIGSLAALILPASPKPGATRPPMDALHTTLFERHKIEIPVFAFPHAPARVLRLSAQLYNTTDHYERLAAAVAFELAKEAKA